MHYKLDMRLGKRHFVHSRLQAPHYVLAIRQLFIYSESYSSIQKGEYKIMH